jgi:hypothetical protein
VGTLEKQALCPTGIETDNAIATCCQLKITLVTKSEQALRWLRDMFVFVR